MTDSSIADIDEGLEVFEASAPKPVVIAGILNGREVFTFCPPGTTLEKAQAVYLPVGVESAREMTAEEVAEAFPEE